MAPRTVRNCIMLGAIEYDIVHELTRGERMHPLCMNTYSCGVCTLGVDAVTLGMDWCPLCGATNVPYSSLTYYNGATNKKYACGTIINICAHCDRRSNSITSIHIGDGCHGINDDDVI